MPMTFSEVPIRLQKGLDLKSESKVAIPGSLAELENGVFTKTGAIQKRSGYDLLGNEIENGAGYISAAKALTVYDNELLLFTGSKVYSYATGSGRWADRGNIVSVAVSERPVIRNHTSQANPDAAYSQGKLVTAWEDSRGGIYYSVIDQDTGSFYVSDTQISTNGTRPKVIVFGLFVCIFYATPDGSLRVRYIGMSQPTVLPTEISICSDMTAANPNFDCVVIGDPVNPGSKIFIAYNRTTAAVSAIRTIGQDLSVSGVTSVAGNSNKCIGIWTDSAQRVWVATSNVQFLLFCYSFTLATIFTVATVDSELPVRVCGYVPSGSSTSTLYYEIPSTNNIASENYVKTNTVAFSGTAGTATVFLRSVGLASKIFVVDSNPYVNVTHGSTFQNSLFTVNKSAQVVARHTPNVGGGVMTHCNLAEVTSISTGIVVFANLVKTLLESNNHQFFSPLGVNLTTMNFVSNQTFQSSVMGKNLLVAGGVLQSYDSVSFTEHGYHLYPEDIAQVATSGFSIVRITTGTAGVAEVTDVTLPAGRMIKGGQYFNLHGVSSPFNYYVWFTVDGVGDDPATGDTGIVVAILNTNTATQVGQAMKAAINAAASANFSCTGAANVIRITNVSNGVVTATAAPAAPSGPASGKLGVGTYLWTVVAEWVDNYGQIHRSAPAPSITATLAVTDTAASLVIPTLRITEKKGARAPIRFAVYRTLANGLLYYRVSSFTQSVANDTTIDYVYFMDNLADSAISSNELLYTTGDVVANVAPGASTISVTYRGRVFLSGMANPLQIVYSKEIIPGDPAAFAEEFFINVDPLGGAVTALGVLDDKLIIFKQNRIYVMSGEGPTPSGALNDYGSPVHIASDVGCNNANSVVQVPTGLMFASSKGLYLLDRSGVVTYIGAPVEDFNSLGISGARLVPETKQVRFTTTETLVGRVLVYDYFYQQWGTFTQIRAVDCDIWRDSFVWAKSDGKVYKENTTKFTDDDRAIKLKLTFNWLSFADILGYQRVRYVHILGNYKSPHHLIVSVATDDNPAFTQVSDIPATTLVGSSTWGSEATWGGTDPVWGGYFKPYTWRVHVVKQVCKNIKISIEDSQNTNPGEGFRINGIQLTVGLRKGAFKMPTAQQS